MTVYSYSHYHTVHVQRGEEFRSALVDMQDKLFQAYFKAVRS